MTEEQTQKIDRKVIAREFRVDLDEQIQDMETKGWTLETDVEVEPYRPNPSSPPWPTVLMTRPIDHPNVLPELRQANHDLRNQVGELTQTKTALLHSYHALARVIAGPTFTDRGGMLRIQDEEAFQAAKELVEDNRERFGPKG